MLKEKFFYLSASLEFSQGKLRNAMISRYYWKKCGKEEHTTRVIRSGWADNGADMEKYMSAYAAIAARAGAKFETKEWIPGVIEHTVTWKMYRFE